MQFTFLSVVHSTIWCSAFIGIVYLLRNIPFIKRRCNASLFVLLYEICMLRCVLPVDFERSVVIPGRQVYPQVYEWVRDSRLEVGRDSISITSILLALWLIGGCFLFARYVICYRRTIRLVRNHASLADERVQGSLLNVMQSKYVDLSVCVIPNILTPCGIGFFRKQIILPSESYGEQELYYILRHEYIHFLNHDFLLKQIAIVFNILFWWNPVAYLLKSDFEQVLEMRCDVAVTRDMSREKKIEYLQTLIRVLQNERTFLSPLPTSVGLSKLKSSSYIVERFNEVAAYRNKSSRKIFSRFLLCGFMLLVFLSYAFIFQPSTDSPNSNDKNVVDFNSSNSYILHTKQGEYWLYVVGMEPFQILEGQAFSYTNFAGIKITEE